MFTKALLRPYYATKLVEPVKSDLTTLVVKDTNG